MIYDVYAMGLTMEVKRVRMETNLGKTIKAVTFDI